MRISGTLLLCALILAGCSSAPEPQLGSFGSFPVDWTGGDEHKWTNGLSSNRYFAVGAFLYVNTRPTKWPCPIEVPPLVGVIEHEEVTHDLDENGVQIRKTVTVRQAWFEGHERAFHIGDSIPGTDWVIRDIFINRRDLASNPKVVATGVEIWREYR